MHYHGISKATLLDAFRLFLVGPLHISQVELFQRTIPFQGRQRRRRHRHFPKELAALAFVPDDLLFFLVSVGFDGF